MTIISINGDCTNNRYRQKITAILYIYDNVSAAMLIWKAQQRFVRFLPDIDYDWPPIMRDIYHLIHKALIGQSILLSL